MGILCTFPDEPHYTEMRRLLDEAGNRGIILRLLGSMAVRVHSNRYASLFETLDRPLADLDFISSQAFSNIFPDFMAEMGYQANQEIMLLFGGERQIYDNPKAGIHVDVFFDRLNFCHQIDLRDRLESYEPTISLADLVLSKLQIINITDKDLADLAILLAEHDLGRDSPETINLTRITCLLAHDWGFFYTCMTNLDKLSSFVIQLTGITCCLRDKIRQRVAEIKRAISAEPKPLQWKMRAKIGPRVKWYTEVDDIP